VTLPIPSTHLGTSSIAITVYDDDTPSIAAIHSTVPVLVESHPGNEGQTEGRTEFPYQCWSVHSVAQ